MANTLRFKRGLVATIPTAVAGEPLFTTDTFDLYIGNGTTNTRFQKYIASGSTSQLLRGDGSLLTMPIVLTSPSNGQVLKYNGTNWVNSSDDDTGITTLNTLTALTQTFATGTTGTDFGIVSSGSTHTFNIPTASGTNRGLLSSADWTTFNNKQNTITNPVTGTGTTNYLPKWTSGSAIGNSQVSDDGTTVTINSRFLNLTNTGESVLTLQDLDGTNQYLYLGQNGGISYFLSRDGSSNGNFVWYQSNGTSTSERMRLTSTGLGIGTTSPGEKLTINGYIGLQYSGTQKWHLGSDSSNNLSFVRSGIAERMVLNSDGNLGLSVVPSAWGGITGVIEMANGVHFFGSDIQAQIGSNSFFNGSNYIYKTTNFASRYFQNIGTHQWYTAPSGTAGNAISFTQAMTLNASGQLGIGTTSPGYKLDVQGAAGNIARITDGTNHFLFYAGSGLNEIATVSPLLLSVGGAERLRINTSGNMGLGVVPSAWESPYKVIQFGSVSSLYDGGSANTGLGNNVFVNTSGSARYITTNYSSLYDQYLGQHRWFTAPSGTAGNAITFTQAMALDANGNFMVGNTSNNGAKVVFMGANGVPATTGTTTTAVLRLSSGTGLYNVLDFGTNESLDYSWIQSTRANSLGTYDRLLIQPNGGAVRIGGTGTTSYKLLVDGTLGVTGAATFSSSVTATQGIFKNSGVPAILAYRDLDVTVVGTAGQGIEFGARNGASTFVSGAAIYGALDNPATTGLMVFQTLTAGSLTTKMTITSAGNVGIGNTSASAKLHATGNILSYTEALNTASLFISANNSYNWQFGIGNNSNFVITEGGGLNAIGTERLRITSGGNLLVGTTSDGGQKLQVNGTGLFTDILTLRTGTNGYNGEITLGSNAANRGRIYYDGDINGQLIFQNTYDSTNTNSGILFQTRTAGTAVNALKISGSGAATFSSTLGINGVADSVKSGTYTPTLTGVYNVTSFTAFELQYIRVGNVVTVSGLVQAIATAANTWTRISITLPISSTFDFSYRAGGGGGASATNNVCAIQAGAFGTSVVYLDSYPNTTSNLGYTFSFTYLIM